MERRAHRPGRTRNVAQRLRQEDPPAPQTRRAYGGRPRFHGGAGDAVPLIGRGTDAARPAPPGIEALPPSGQDALRPPRRLRRPAPRLYDLALLPGVGAPGSAPFDDGGTACALPALLLNQPPHRRPRRTPIVLVVFHDELAATHFLRVAQEQMARSDVEVPLLVSHRGLLESEGPLGRAWLAPGGRWEAVHALQPASRERTRDGG